MAEIQRFSFACVLGFFVFFTLHRFYMRMLSFGSFWEVFWAVAANLGDRLCEFGLPFCRCCLIGEDAFFICLRLSVFTCFLKLQSICPLSVY